MNINSEKNIRTITLFSKYCFISLLIDTKMLLHNKSMRRLNNGCINWRDWNCFWRRSFNVVRKPLLWISWIFIKRNLKLSLICSIISPLVCLSFLLFNRIIDDEAGHYNEIIGYKMGYWLWLTSSLVMLTGNLILYASKQRVVIKS
jgi:hypothetical protein